MKIGSKLYYYFKSMENHGLGTHNDKTDSSTGNIPNIPQFIVFICKNWPIIWDILKKPCPWWQLNGAPF